MVSLQQGLLFAADKRSFIRELMPIADSRVFYDELNKLETV